MNKWELNQKLKALFLKKQAANPRLSIRGYAKSLGLSSSTLIKAMNNQIPLGPKTCRILQQKTGERFVYVKAKTTSVSFDQRAATELNQNLPWFYLGLQELLEAQTTTPTVNPGKARFLLSQQRKNENLSISDLLKSFDEMGQLKVVKNKKEISPSGAVAFNVKNPIDSAKAKEIQFQMLEASAQAVREIPISERHQQSLFLRLHADQVPEAQKLCIKFVNDLAKLVDRGPNGHSTHIYAAQVGLFPFINLTEKGIAK